MLPQSIVCLAIFLCTCMVQMSQSHIFDPKPPKHLIDRIWKKARLGELLTPEGWHRLSGSYSNPSVYPGEGMIPWQACRNSTEPLRSTVTPVLSTFTPPIPTGTSS